MHERESGGKNPPNYIRDKAQSLENPRAARILNQKDIRVPLAALNICAADSLLRLRYQEWPRDIEVRRNMVTSTWKDAYDLLASKKADVVNEQDEPIPMDQFLREMKEAGRAAALRFAVVIGEDQRVQLQLQGLPASAASLMGKPAFRG
jgi:hypothetical protein